MDSRVCWEILESEFHAERAPLQELPVAALTAAFSQCRMTLSVHSPVHFYHTASPKIGIGFSQRQCIRINFRLKPSASDDFLLPRNSHTLPCSSILSVQGTPWPWVLPSIPESCTLLWEHQVWNMLFINEIALQTKIKSNNKALWGTRGWDQPPAKPLKAWNRFCLKSHFHFINLFPGGRSSEHEYFLQERNDP